MRIGQRLLNPETARWLGGALRSGTLSRYGLARGLCELEDWRNPKGKLCVSSAAKALPGLAKQLHLKLPAPRERPGQGGPPCWTGTIPASAPGPRAVG